LSDYYTTVAFPGYPGGIRKVTNFDGLRFLQSRTLCQGSDILVEGGVDVGDGNGGTFVYDATCVLSDDDYTVIMPADLAATSAGRWRVIARGPIGPRGQMGQVGNTGSQGPQGIPGDAAQLQTYVTEAGLYVLEAASYAGQAQLASTATGVYPAAYSTALPHGLTSIAIGGTAISGATPGTYPLVIGGSINGAAATLNVTSPTTATVTITNAGLGTTSTAPTITAPSGATLPAGTTLTGVVGILIPDQKSYWVSSADGQSIYLYANSGGAVVTAPIGQTQLVQGAAVIQPVATAAAASAAQANTSAIAAGLNSNRTWGNGGIRFPETNGASSKAVSGNVILNNSFTALLSYGFGSDGFIGFYSKFPVWSENQLRRDRKFIGSGPSRTAGNALTISWQGANGFYNPVTQTGSHDNRAVFNYVNSSLPILWTAGLPPVHDATTNKVVDVNNATCIWNTTFPPSINENGDSMMKAYYAVARIGNTMQFLAYDLTTGLTYHGPAAAYSGTGATALLTDIVFGGDTPTVFPPIAADTAFSTSMIGEMGLFTVYSGSMANADANMLSWLRGGVDFTTAFGKAPVLQVTFNDGAGNFSNAVTWNGGDKQLTMNPSPTGFNIGDTVYQTPVSGGAFSTATAVGTVIAVNPTTLKMVVKTTSGAFVIGGATTNLVANFTTPGPNTRVTAALALTTPTLTVQGEIMPGSTARPMSLTKRVHPHGLKWPCLIPVNKNAIAGEISLSGTTEGLVDGTQVQVQWFDDAGNTSPWQTFTTVLGNAYAGFADIEDHLYARRHRIRFVSYNGATLPDIEPWIDQTPIYTGTAIQVNGQSQCSLLFSYGATTYNDSTAVTGDQTAGTAPIQPVITSDAINHVWFATNAGNAPLASAGSGKPSWIGGKACDLHSLGSRRLTVAETLFRRRPGNYFILENYVAGTGEFQEMSDNQSDLDPMNAITYGGPISAYERNWQDRERLLGLLGSVSRRGLYNIQVMVHYWGSATNAPDYDAKFDAIYFGIPSVTGACIYTSTMCNEHHEKDGKTLDPAFDVVIMPFPMAISGTYMGGDQGARLRGQMHDSMAAWVTKGHPDTLYLGPPTDVYYPAGWNYTMINPTQATHSQIDLDLGTPFIAEMFAEACLVPFGASGYKGQALPAFIETNPTLPANKIVRFADSTQTSIIVPITGPYYEQLLGRMVERNMTGVNPVGLNVWGFEYGTSIYGTTPVNLIGTITDRRTITLTLGNGAAFPNGTMIKFHPGGPGSYDYVNQQKLFVNADGTPHALAPYWCCEYWTKWTPTWGRFQVDAYRDDGVAYIVSPPAS
jgi:hypothetical protein